MSREAMDAVLAAEGIERIEELVEWRYDHRHTAIGAAVFQNDPLTPQLIEAQKSAMLEILESNSLSEKTADDVLLAAWDART